LRHLKHGLLFPQTQTNFVANLKETPKTADRILLTGRIRPLDRDKIWETWRKKIAAQPNRPQPEKTLFVVATQCVEAGANIDFDALVTECASLDALRQRFGRLNCLGNHESVSAVIVGKENEIELTNDGSAKNPHPVYGHALAKTWQWLLEQKENDTVNFAHESLSPKLPSHDALQALLPPQKHAVILLPAHLDALCQTQPEPVPSPDVHFFLRGPNTELPSVSILWRKALNGLSTGEDALDDWIEAVSACAPSSLEMMQIPLYAARAWLSRKETSAGIGADLESEEESSDKEPESSKQPIPCLRWRGEDSDLVTDPASIRPGDTIVVPAGAGGCDHWGWNPASTAEVLDLSATVSQTLRSYPLAYLSDVDDSTRKTILSLLDAEEPDTEALATVYANMEAFKGIAPEKIEVLRFPSSDAPFALRSTVRIKVSASEPEEELFLDQDSYRRGKEVDLDNHLNGVAAKAKTYAETLGLTSLVNLYEKGGLLHDFGKADPRFQLLLHNGDAIKAASILLAKSRPVPHRLRKKIREASGYPSGARHEFLSVSLLQTAGESDELLLHLIAAHHGHARALAPVVFDSAPVDVTTEIDGKTITASSAHGLEKIGSGIARRFWSLTRHYGWWGLAYLETILRLADHRQSEEEQQ